ncbi:NAD-dependent epimerase/dehydratase family protein [Terrabacter sp. MAHUQ-38]|uniref:NAD-dependent epimerase/dehydratase family protein n=1 Tax=unclassified Terrabacter TaxID=2630222 RepID=UPI00165EB300|nr:NAD-dependent epimerase/dehydratase family protein [Terrabacter sp. MAHUQ-38]MBC9820562.1 NAD-dependent epimerase/dehydratase family protein [Terrabacter sp. MAHUQ-38]
MRVAVTGATGLVGHHVVAAALAAGHDAVAVTRLGRRVPDRLRALGPVTSVAAELTDRTALTRALDGVDAVIHSAAVYSYQSAARELADVNVTGTRHVLEAAAAAGVTRAVVTSSAVTCGSSVEPRSLTESDHLGSEPAPAYYTSKVLQEREALDVAGRTGLEVVLALPTVVLGGPFDRLGPSNAIVLRYLLDPSRSTFPGGCNVVDARDVGAGHVTLLERGEPGERYLLGGDDVPWRTLHSLVGELAGVGRPAAELPAGVAWLAAAAAEGWARVTSTTPLSTREEASTVGRYYWYSSGRAHALGYAPRPARQAVASSLAWLAISPDLPRVVRETLRLGPEVRAERPLQPRPLVDEVSPRPRPPRPARSRPRPSPR